MRKLVLVVSAFVVACGSDSNSSSSGGPLAGTVGGRAFTIADVKAIPASSGATPCEITLGTLAVTAGIKAIALEVTSYADACGDFTDAGCTLHQSAQSVTVVLARIVPQSITTPNPDVTSVPFATPGATYKIHVDPTTVEADGATGYVYASYALALATNATCVGTPPAVQTGGTIRFDQVTGPVTGYVSVTFANGDTLHGDFSAPLCTGAGPDVCQIATSDAANPLCPTTPACVP